MQMKMMNICFFCSVPNQLLINVTREFVILYCKIKDLSSLLLMNFPKYVKVFVIAKYDHVSFIPRDYLMFSI